jgi:hypothetical protein
MLPTAASLNSCLQRPLSCECICQMLFSSTFDPKTAWARKAFLHWARLEALVIRGARMVWESRSFRESRGKIAHDNKANLE